MEEVLKRLSKLELENCELKKTLASVRRDSNVQRQQQQQTQRQQEQQQRLQNHQQQQLHQQRADIEVVATHTINNQVAVGNVGAVVYSARRPISEMWDRHQRQASPPPQPHSSSPPRQSAKDRLGRPPAITFPTPSPQGGERMDVEVGDWAAASSGLQAAEDDDVYTLDPPPRREAYRGGAKGLGRKPRQ